LSGDTADWQPKIEVRRDDSSSDFDGLFWLLFLLLFMFVWWRTGRHAPPRRRPGFYSLWPVALGRRIWRGFGGGFGGGFSGGGGWVAAAIREAEQRTSGQIRLRARAFVVGLCACACSVGERAGAVHAMAAHSLHGMERAAHFFCSSLWSLSLPA